MERFFSKYTWEIGSFSTFDAKVEYNSFALNLFVEIILMWWPLTAKDLLILTLFWKIFFHFFGKASVSCNHWKWNVLLNVLIYQFVSPTFCFCFTFTDINFRGMLHHVCDVAYDKNMCGPIKISKCSSTNWLILYMIWFVNAFFPMLPLTFQITLIF